MINATGGGLYDFKSRGYDGVGSYELHCYRGMPFFGDIATARDIGNAAAGFMAGKEGFGWSMTRLAFDGLESVQNWRLSIECPTSQNAQRYGYGIGLFFNRHK